jgi:hypothetical protein
MTSTAEPQPGVSPPGFYRTSSGGEQWWDGNKWRGREHSNAGSPSATPQREFVAPTNDKPLSGQRLVWLGLGLIVVMVALSIFEYVTAEPGETYFVFPGAVVAGMLLVWKGLRRRDQGR